MDDKKIQIERGKRKAAQFAIQQANRAQDLQEGQIQPPENVVLIPLPARRGVAEKVYDGVGTAYEDFMDLLIPGFGGKNKENGLSLDAEVTTGTPITTRQMADIDQATADKTVIGKFTKHVTDERLIGQRGVIPGNPVLN